MSLQNNYRAKASAEAKDNYRAFQDKWDEECARRFQERVNGDDDIIIINKPPGMASVPDKTNSLSVLVMELFTLMLQIQLVTT